MKICKKLIINSSKGNTMINSKLTFESNQGLKKEIYHKIQDKKILTIIPEAHQIKTFNLR
jgi:hypothetical protein